MVLGRLEGIGKLLNNREDRMETGIVAPIDIALSCLVFIIPTS